MNHDGKNVRILPFDINSLSYNPMLQIIPYE